MNDPYRSASDWDPRFTAEFDAGADPSVEEAAEGEEPSLDEERLLPQGFAEWFVVALTAIPAMLYLPGSQAYRLPLRIGAYAIALVGFALWWFRGARRDHTHPSHGWLVFVVVYLGVMIFHPLTSGLLAGAVSYTHLTLPTILRV